MFFITVCLLFGFLNWLKSFLNCDRIFRWNWKKWNRLARRVGIVNVQKGGEGPRAQLRRTNQQKVVYSLFYRYRRNGSVGKSEWFFFAPARVRSLLGAKFFLCILQVRLLINMSFFVVLIRSYMRLRISKQKWVL